MLETSVVVGNMCRALAVTRAEQAHQSVVDKRDSESPKNTSLNGKASEPTFLRLEREKEFERLPTKENSTWVL